MSEINLNPKALIRRNNINRTISDKTYKKDI